MLKLFFLFGYFNLFFLSKDKKKKVKKRAKINITKTFILFKYKKVNKKY